MNWSISSKRRTSLNTQLGIVSTSISMLFNCKSLMNLKVWRVTWLPSWSNWNLFCFKFNVSLTCLRRQIAAQLQSEHCFQHIFVIISSAFVKQKFSTRFSKAGFAWNLNISDAGLKFWADFKESITVGFIVLCYIIKFIINIKSK